MPWNRPSALTPALALAVALAGALPTAALRAADRLVEDFESAAPRAAWRVTHDDNHLGTLLQPEPFAPSPGGAPGSPRGCGRIHGRLGLNQAPWTWAQLLLQLDKDGKAVDLGRYRSLRFWVKGDGGEGEVSLVKASVTDSDHYSMTFRTGPEWREVRLPLAAFRQAGWGKSVPHAFGDATAVMFSPVAHDAPFDFSVDAVAFSEDDAELRPVPYDSALWWPYTGVDPDARKGGPLDAGFLSDGPAGSHGRVRAAGEAFAYGDGRPVRFFGVNLVASCNFMSHAQADATAQLLSEMGVNITRMHHLEATWTDRNIFGRSAPGTRALDAESMDRFDYLVAALQKRGIYQYFDLLVSRAALGAYGVKDPASLGVGWKISGEFAPDLLALETEFTAQFLGHRNAYTGRRYAEDPGVAMLELVNEDSEFYRSADGEFSARGAYAAELQGLFNAWLRKRYAGRRELDRAWAPDDAAQLGLAEDEDPAAGTVRPIRSWQDDSWRSLSPARAADELRFTYDLQSGYYADRVAELRSLGYQGLVTGSNHWTPSPADLLANARLGSYVDRHAYYAHPQGGWGYSPAVRFDPSPMLRTEGLGIVGELAARRVKGLPYIATEWQCAAPNEYRADAVLDMAMACDLQGWSAVQFAFRHSSLADLTGFAGALDNNFDVANQPAMLALWPAAAILARRGDLSPAGAAAWCFLSPAEALKPGAAYAAPGRAALMAECGVAFEAAPGVPAAAPQPQDGWSVGAGGAVRHDPARGLLLIDTAGTQAVAGFSRGAQAATSRLSVDLENEYAVVVATALDSADLATARRILLTAVDNAVNEGMTLAPSGDQIAAPGGPRVLVQPVVGRVRLSLPRPAGARAWALDPSGRRLRELAAEQVEGGIALRLAAGDRAMHYVVELPGASAP